MSADGPDPRQVVSPGLSVVVPTWNEEARLPDLLDSLAQDEPRPLEVLVCDGGSGDRTCALAEDAGARVLRVARRGRGVQLAQGAREARGDVLWFLHADMRVQPGSMRALMRAFEDPGLDACGVRQRIAAEGRVYRWIESVANRRVRRGVVYGDSGLAVRRAAYEAVGGFRDQPLFEDLDLSQRLLKTGRPVRPGRPGQSGATVRLVEDACVTISPRRWQREGPVRRTLLNRLLTVAWRAGVAPERLARYYRPEALSGDPQRRTS